MILVSPAHTAFVSFGWRQALQERAVMLVQLVTYTLLIAIFASVFLITPFHELPTSMVLNATIMIWYIIVTEVITFAGGGQNFHEIRGEILGGQFSASLQRPKSYFRMKIWTWVGANMIRASVFLAGGFALGLLFTHGIPYSGIQFLMLLLSVYIATLIYTVVYFMLALIEVWGPYARPAMWISQKCAFLFGGLILPLQLYPHWMQTLAHFTPYPAMLNIPGKIAFDPSFTSMATGIGIQVLWLIITIVVAIGVQYLAYRHILKRGY
jgi:ABC-2 type transport system permease protein